MSQRLVPIYLKTETRENLKELKGQSTYDELICKILENKKRA